MCVCVCVNKYIESLFNFVFGENLVILGIGLVMLKVNIIL